MKLTRRAFGRALGAGLAAAALPSAVKAKAPVQEADPPRYYMYHRDAVGESDIQVFAGGVTWVDAEYDECLAKALRPLSPASHWVARLP